MTCQDCEYWVDGDSEGKGYCSIFDDSFGPQEDDPECLEHRKIQALERIAFLLEQR